MPPVQRVGKCRPHATEISRNEKWRCQFLSTEWLKIIEEVAYKKIIGCNNVSKLRGLGMYLFRVSCS
jgi:hypothetical protein